MTREDQHTDLKSLRTIVGKSADWCALTQKALNHPRVFGSRSQKPKRQSSKSLISKEFLFGSMFQMSQIRTKYFSIDVMAYTNVRREDCPVRPLFAAQAEVGGYKSGMAYPFCQQPLLEHT